MHNFVLDEVRWPTADSDAVPKSYVDHRVALGIWYTWKPHNDPVHAQLWARPDGTLFIWDSDLHAWIQLAGATLGGGGGSGGAGVWFNEVPPEEPQNGQLWSQPSGTLFIWDALLGVWIQLAGQQLGGGKPDYLTITGGVMEGPLILHSDATNPMEAVPLRQLESLLGSRSQISHEPPEHPNPGDLWFDTTDSQTYIWSGAAWVIVVNPGPPAAAVGFTPPEQAVKGNFFWDEGEAQLYVFDGDRWVIAVNPPQLPIPIPVNLGGTGATSIREALANLGAANSHVGSVPPTGPHLGDLWWDTLSSQTYLWTGEAWVVAVNPPVPAAAIGYTPPEEAAIGNFFWDQGENQLYVYDGEKWVIAVNPPQLPMPLPVQFGGTGADNGPQALDNLGISVIVSDIEQSISDQGDSFNQSLSDLGSNLGQSITDLGDHVDQQLLNYLLLGGGTMVPVTDGGTGIIIDNVDAGYYTPSIHLSNSNWRGLGIQIDNTMTSRGIVVNHDSGDSAIIVYNNNNNTGLSYVSRGTGTGPHFSALASDDATTVFQINRNGQISITNTVNGNGIYINNTASVGSSGVGLWIDNNTTWSGSTGAVFRTNGVGGAASVAALAGSNQVPFTVGNSGTGPWAQTITSNTGGLSVTAGTGLALQTVGAISVSRVAGSGGANITTVADGSVISNAVGLSINTQNGSAAAINIGNNGNGPSCGIYIAQGASNTAPPISIRRAGVGFGLDLFGVRTNGGVVIAPDDGGTALSVTGPIVLDQAAIDSLKAQLGISP